MEPIPDPDAALQLHPEWAAVRFPSGEWLFGCGVNSHGFGPGHGTLVLKDSRGQVRIFFGHVCGENDWVYYRHADVHSPDALYARLTEGTYREWIPDP